LGDFELIIALSTILVISSVIYNLITSASFRDILRRFGALKPGRRDFYECGFKPRPQKPVQLSIQFVLLCVFFILYDIEFAFMLPYVAGFMSAGLTDTLLFILFFSLLLISLIIDFERHALY
jgi:NADH:ubiquinone oxidoreductase subunit 3 (subunit A)